MLRYIFSLFFVFATTFLWSQTTQQEQLELRKAQIQKEIRDNEKLLKTVKSKEKSALNVFYIQKNKIELKEKLINTTEKQLKIVSNNMYINQMKINKLNKELEILKEDYSSKILKSYKSRSEQSRAMFILSSDNFLQAYKRAQYLKQYTNFRKAQGEEIFAKSTELQVYNQKLSGQKQEKKVLLVENEKEKASLVQEKVAQEKVVKTIKKDKVKLLADIKAKQRESKNIDAQINRLIREAIAEANRKAALEREKAKALANNSTDTPKEVAAKAAKTVVSSSKIELTPEDKLVADNFRSSKGRLPWPVEKGFISLGYGNQTHPIYTTLVVHNSGVEITTESGASARAVFAGEVSKVIVLSPVNKAVVIQHGDYFTVYQNLSSVSVSTGDKVSIKQNIGKVRTNAESGKAVIKFLILQNTAYADPQGWLSVR